MPRWLPIFMAVLLPLGVLLAGLHQVQDFADQKEAEARRHAGHVINGDRVHQPADVEIRALLDERSPRVLILGNSLVNNAIDASQLARALDMPESEILMLSIPGSISAHWYAILKNHVYGQGHQPTLVMIVGSLQSLLDAVPTSTAMRENLDVHLGDHEPLLMRKAYPSQLSGFWLHRFRANRGKVRNVLMENTRGLTVGTLWHDPTDPRPVLHQGYSRAEIAHARVFAHTQLDFSVLDVHPLGGGGENLDVDRLPHPSEGFVPNLAQLTKRHGSKFLFIRTPLSPHVSPQSADVVPEGWEALTAEILASGGGKMLDLGDMELGALAYKDPVHMRASGRARFTKIVGAHVSQLQGHVSDVGWWAPRFEPRTPQPDHAPFVLAGGETSTWVFDHVWPGPGARFRVQARLNGDVSLKEAPTLVLDSMTLLAAPDGQGFRMDGWLKRPSTAPWELQIHNPNDSPLELAALAFGDFQHLAYVHGQTRDLKGHALALVGGEREPVVVRDDRRAEPQPRMLPLQSGPRNTGIYSLPGFAPLFDALTQQDVVSPSSCSPVEVIERGRPLPSRGVTCARIAHERPGRSCFDGERVYFTTSDRRPPQRNGRVYQVRLHPDRVCGHHVWLYPGETTRFAVSAEQRSLLPAGPDKLALTLLTTEAPGTIEVHVKDDSGDRLHVVHSPKPDTPQSGFVRRLTPVDAEPGHLEVTLHNNSEERFVLVTYLALRS